MSTPRLRAPRWVRLGLALTALLAGVTAHADTAPPGALRDLALRARESVVLLRVFDSSGAEAGTGTGFFVAVDRIVSNHHVIAGASAATAELADRSKLEVLGIIAADPENDLVILAVPPARNPPLTLATGEPVQVGDPIVVLGGPLGLAGTLTEGIVSAIRDDGLEESHGGRRTPAVLQISAAISPGSSGSPVMRLDGQVVGVAASQFIDGQNLNFAVPVRKLSALLERSRGDGVAIPFGTAEKGSPWLYARNLGISLAFFAGVYRLVMGRWPVRRRR